MAGVNPNQILASIERTRALQRPREETTFNGDLSALESAEGFGPSGVDYLRFRDEEFIGMGLSSGYSRSKVVPLPTVQDESEYSETESDASDEGPTARNSHDTNHSDSLRAAASRDSAKSGASGNTSDDDAKNAEGNSDSDEAHQDSIPNLNRRESILRNSTSEHTSSEKFNRQALKSDAASSPAPTSPTTDRGRRGSESSGSRTNRGAISSGRGRRSSDASRASRRSSEEIINAEMQDGLGELPSVAGRRLQVENEKIEETKKRWRKVRLATKTMTKIKQVEEDMRLYGTTARDIDDTYDETDPRYYSQQGFSSKPKSKFILEPKNRFRRIWEVMMVAMLLYVVVTVPVRVCFDIEATGGAANFDLLVDVLFILDIFVNSVCAYEDRNGELVVDLRLIFIHYARTWLIIDLIASVPLYKLMSYEDEAQMNRLGKIARLPRLLRLMKLLRLLKLLRVFKLMRYFQQWERHNIGMNGVVTRMFKVIFGVFMVTHLIGCFWYYMAWAGHDVIPIDSWVVQYGIQNQDDITKYLTSVYWSFSTLTTIGYGDVRASTNREKLFSIVCMVVGVSWYAFIISTISSIVTMFDRRTAAVKRKQRLLVDFMRETSMPWAMRRRIMTYFDYVTTREGGDADPNEMASILSMLSTQLRTEVTLHIHRNLIPRVPFFLKKSPQFIASTVAVLRPLQFSKGDYISTRGQHADEMYFLIEGRAVVVLADGRKFKSIIAGSYFGEIGCILSEKHRVSIVAANECHIYALSKNDLKNLMDEYPDVASEIRLNAKRRLEHVNMRRNLSAAGNVDASSIRAQNFQTSFPGVATRDLESDNDADEIRSQLSAAKSYSSLADAQYEEHDEDLDDNDSGGAMNTVQFKALQTWMSKVDQAMDLLIKENRELRGSLDKVQSMLAQN